MFSACFYLDLAAHSLQMLARPNVLCVVFVTLIRSSLTFRLPSLPSIFSRLSTSISSISIFSKTVLPSNISINSSNQNYTKIIQWILSTFLTNFLFINMFSYLMLPSKLIIFSLKFIAMEPTGKSSISTDRKISDKTVVSSA